MDNVDNRRGNHCVDSVENVLHWGLDPSYNSFRKVILFDLITNVNVISAADAIAFTLHGRPLRKVEVVGIVSNLVRREKKLSFVIDDGTASIHCIKYCDNDTIPFPFLEPGQLISIRATLVVLETNLSPYGLMLQVKRLDLTHPNAELMHWISSMNT